uniref:Centriole, cilia and spindle associated protein n=1 Tax=Erpetoichthys calabaricus TaxID=27687 RepID=A0A8C4RQ99_ERPCA
MSCMAESLAEQASNKRKQTLTKKLRSEYMKKFKAPKWETYYSCYEDMLSYRLNRRLLEQTHNPWIWDDWKKSPDSSGSTTPIKRKSGEPPETPKETNDAPLTLKIPGTTDVESKPELKNEDPMLPISSPRKDSSTQTPQEPNANRTVKTKNNIVCKPSRKKTQKKQVPQQGKENKHPFLLYGWAEKKPETGNKKTYNVRPSTSTTEIHNSALRAKMRREVEKKLKALENPQTHLNHLERKQWRPSQAENPWISEYMRCFSA